MRYLISLVLISTFSLNSFAAATYTKEIDFCPFSASYSQLADLVEKIRTVIKDSNKKELNEYGSERMTIESRSIKVDLEKNFTRDDLLSAPLNAISIRYSIHDRGELPIGDVTIYLTDALRQVEVSGQSKDHIDTVVAVIQNHMNEIGCSYGGSRHRLFGGFLLLIVAAFLPPLASAFKVSSRLLPFTWVLSVLLFILIHAPSWENIFPGTLITLSDEGFLSRNSAVLTISGLGIGILGLVFSVYFGLKGSWSEKPEGDTEDEENA
jgi:hypothetical protein